MYRTDPREAFRQEQIHALVPKLTDSLEVVARMSQPLVHDLIDGEVTFNGPHDLIDGEVTFNGPLTDLADALESAARLARQLDSHRPPAVLVAV